MPQQQPARVAILVPLLYGAGWGVAQVLFGLSIARLGMALGYAIIIGLGAVLGTLVPLFVQHRSATESTRGLLIFGGVGVIVLGIAVSAWAGRLREARPGRTSAPPGDPMSCLGTAMGVGVFSKSL